MKKKDKFRIISLPRTSFTTREDKNGRKRKYVPENFGTIYRVIDTAFKKKQADGIKTYVKLEPGNFTKRKRWVPSGDPIWVLSMWTKEIKEVKHAE